MTDTALESRVLAHYRMVGPALEQHFGGSPIVFANFPSGFAEPANWHRTGVPLSETKMLWLCHRMFAIEFHTWAPLPGDLDRLRFARILLLNAPSRTQLNRAALAIRALLAQSQLEAVPLLDGRGGIALWVPFADAPHALPLRTWLHAFCARAVAQHPDLLSTEFNTHDDRRVHLHVSSNAPGHYSVMPYSARGLDALPVSTPFRWNELDSLEAAPTLDAFAQRFEQHGDLFGKLLALIPPQRFEKLDVPAQIMPIANEPRGSAITAALDILEDGKARTADQILAEALARNLVQPNMTKKYVYTTLVEYIARTLGYGRKPLLVQNEDRTFRINEPADDWPQLDPLPQPPALDANAQALIARLEQSSTGDDPAAFEIATCDAFAHLGFASTHLGGEDAPDGYADAQLGILGFRLMIECKTAKGIVTQPDCVEASKYCAPYHADFATLVGPEFGEEEELADELRTHGVTAVTVADLRTLIALGATPLDVRAVLKPGFAADFLGDLLWERTHGLRKRIATIAHLVREAGWNAQVTAAQQGGRTNAPLLTIDAAMLLVDASLHALGSMQACTREDVQTAFVHLTDPLVAQAVWTDPTHTAIVITAVPSAALEDG